jgi:hypothetical protein
MAKPAEQATWDEVSIGSGSDRVTIAPISILLLALTRSLPLPVLTSCCRG